MEIQLLKDIIDNYYNVNFKAGSIVNTMPTYQCLGEESKDKVIAVHGHGAYTYAKHGEYIIV